MSNAPEPPTVAALDADELVWNAPEPAQGPLPTYAPGGVALGIAMGVFGMLTHWIMTVAGVLLFGASLWSWIRAIRGDWSRAVSSERRSGNA